VHYQFETIHPFPDGSGRLGRLLIPLVLLARGRLRAPLLDPSPEIKSRRQEYVDRLLAVSLEGRWTEWIAFFLEIARGSSRESIDLTSRLEALREDYLRKVQEARSAGLLAKLIDRIFAQPLLSIPQAQKLLRVTYRAAKLHVDRLCELGIREPWAGTSQPRLHWARGVVASLAEGRALIGGRGSDEPLQRELPL